MPKRSNLFQRLVKLLHDRIDKNWIVTESKMLTHRLTGEEREVDIVLESNLGAHSLIVSIECVDKKRPASSPWVESMAKKHEFLPTSKLVLWSANGFYRPAIVTAEKLGIDIVSQSDNTNIEWSKFSKILNGGTLKLVHSEFKFFIDAIEADGKKVRLDNPHDYIFKAKDREIFFSILELREFLIGKQEIGSVLLDHASEDKKDFWIHFVPPFECLVQKENGDWIEPFRIGFGVRATVEEAKTDAKSVVYKDTLSTLAVGDLNSGSFELFIEEKENEDPEISAQLVKKTTNKAL